MDQRFARELTFENAKMPVIQDVAPVTAWLAAAWAFADSEAALIRQVPEVVRLYPELQTEQIETEEQVLQDSTVQFNTVTDINFWVVVPETAELM